MQIHMSIIIGRLSQLDHGRVETNFGYRTWKFQYLCNFLSTMEWSGPNIQDPLCQYNKNEKKLNYLVTTHERFRFGVLNFWMAFSRKKAELLQGAQIFSEVDIPKSFTKLEITLELQWMKNSYLQKAYIELQLMVCQSIMVDIQCKNSL